MEQTTKKQQDCLPVVGNNLPICAPVHGKVVQSALGISLLGNISLGWNLTLIPSSGRHQSR